MEERVFFKKKDLIIVAVIFLAMFLVGFLQENMPGTKAEVIYDGKVIDTLSLNKEFSISYNEKPEVVLEVLDSKIRFHSSDCPDKICVNTGFLQYLGESAACLPNKMIIRIINGAENPVDAVSK